MNGPQNFPILSILTFLPLIGGVIVIGLGADRKEDRKSTRLNSSHLVISYAVFCLKKKKSLSYNPTEVLIQNHPGHNPAYRLHSTRPLPYRYRNKVAPNLDNPAMAHQPVHR